MLFHCRNQTVIKLVSYKFIKNTILMQTNNITLFELSMVTKLKTFLDIDFTTYQIVNEKDRKKGTFNDLRFCTKIATSLT